MKRCTKCGAEANWNTADCPICFGLLESICPSDAADCSPSSSRKYENRCGEIWEWDGQKWRELFSSDVIQRLDYYERKISEIDDDRNELRAIAKEALGSFRCTQRPEMYPEGDWSRRAQSLLENVKTE